MIQSREPVRLDAQGVRQASGVMARAFQDEPAWKYLIPDASKRSRWLPSFFSIVIRYTLLYGEVYTTPSLEGVACWLPPGNTTPRLSQLVRLGIRHASLGFALGWTGFRRHATMEAYDSAVHAQFAPGKHWYLWGLGVDPTYQGQGIGGMLLQPVLARAEADRLPCYLETSTAKNVSFYSKHGFVVVHEGKVPKSQLYAWAMLRRYQ
ncbi:MAG TPA: GNAT family N-acetyltransferase [Ktedonobacteraceae bacterium]|jgi:ribosomal protein S18 acetylase RimI-like enzyme|nr:GNAT family N-acetyltransferase [Ktedonobacteraceae bacterium]